MSEPCFWRIIFDHLRGFFFLVYLIASYLCWIYHIYSYDWSTFNTFCCNFIHFTIYFFDLAWILIIIYSITYFNYCSDLSILEYLFYVYYLRHNLNCTWRFWHHWIISLFDSMFFSFFKSIYPFCSWQMSSIFIICKFILILQG